MVKLSGKLFIVTLLIGIVFPLQVYSFETSKGVIDAKKWDFSKKGVITLKGEWEFYWLQLLNDEDFEDSKTSPEYISLPTSLDQYEINNKPIPSDGYSTLRLKVQIEDKNQLYGLKSNYLTSAYKVWVNGKLVAYAGEVSILKENFLAQYYPMVATFMPTNDEVEIVIHLANFHHNRMRISPIYFGLAEDIQEKTHNGLIRDSVLFGSLLLVSLYHLILFFLHKRGKAMFFLACIAFITAMRVAIVNERILVRVFPDFPSELLMKIGYLPVFILVPLLVIYFNEIFKLKELIRPVKASIYIIFITFFIIVIAPLKFYDQLFAYGQSFYIIFGLYVLFVIITKIPQEKQRGMLVTVIGGIITFFTGVNDVLRELDIIHTPEMLTIGITIFILSQAVYLAWSYNDVFRKTVLLASENKRMFNEIQELNNNLEEKVKQRTEEIEYANYLLEQLSKVDPLTQIPNRRFFDEWYEESWVEGLKSKTPLSVMMIDIDHFKSYNDLYGHLQGDVCLKYVVNELKNSLNDVYFLARFGGEEFVVVLPNTDERSAIDIGETVRQSIENLAISHKGSTTNDIVTISIGISTCIPSLDELAINLLNQADQALYSVKKQKRNSVRIFSGLTDFS